MSRSGIRELPRIMVAPTGARRTKADHPALPISPWEILDCAIACHAAGAGAIHAHVRDDEGGHSLDIDRYRHLMALLRTHVPDMIVQISTEAVGLYGPDDQMELVRLLKPDFVSVALREILGDDGDEQKAAAFYRWCEAEGISVQHILYDAADVGNLAGLQRRGLISQSRLSVIYVLGRYSPGQESHPDDLKPFLEASRAFVALPDWMVCAFGRGETDCLAAALAGGGKARVGFENSFWHRDGRLAASNAERVEVIRGLAGRLLQEGAA
ncbi:3-keto-5-aminohexanoate cleavage protein [Neorhizobium sp. DT-125]|uniref:3-keto-5-aminohexanoate cleavage protein n=1 Tax=Neorhizobium sp. DT-125 TaxID=3396163 RepID=UPI003F19CE1B